MNPSADTFGACVAAAVLAPNHVDTAMLTRTADDMLTNVIPGNPGSPEIIEAARRLAHAALDFGIFHTAEDYRRLYNATRAFEMLAALHA